MNATAASVVLASSLSAAGAATCRHCGDPCGDGTVRTGRGAFCCAGCEAVYSLLESHGLTAFYTCDVQPGMSQRRTRDRGRFAVLDDEEVARRFVQPGGGEVATAIFSVPAMHCASCLWLLEQLWRFDAGIARSEADLLRRTVRIDFRPQATTVRAVAEQLAALGYEPVIDSERTPGQTPHAHRSLILKIGVAGFAFGNVMLFSIPRYVNGAPLDGGFQRLFDVLNVLFAIPVLLYSASPYFQAAWSALRARTITLEVPVALGLVVLFARSVTDITMAWGEGFLDSFAGLVFFLLIGRLFQQKAFDAIAFDRTVRSFFPLSVRVEQRETAGGSAPLDDSSGRPEPSRRGGATPPRLLMTPLERLHVGDVMVIRPHEVIPADSTLVDRDGAIDYAFVSGEATPTLVEHGQRVHAGGRVIGRALRLAVIRDVSHSRLAELWDNPVFARPKADWLTRITAAFGFWFVVLAVGLAAAGAWGWWPDLRMAANVATAVLIIACPCALTLAAPITLGTAMGLLGRTGCFLKRASVGLDLSRVDTVVFDKTGTLTATAADSSITRAGFGEGQWALVQRLAAESAHPLSRAISGRDPLPGVVAGVREVAGQGLAGTVDGHRVVLGTAQFVAWETGHDLPSGGHRTWASIDDGIAGWMQFGTPERPGMIEAVRALGRRYDVWLLSGDHDDEHDRWATIFTDRLRFRQSPDDKLAAIQAMQASGRRVLMVGDGLNDAGALAAADVGLAVSDDTACLVPACDAVIRGDRLADLPRTLEYARRARRVIVLCFTVSILYNAIGLGLALAGRLTPLATAVLMPVSSLTVVGLSVGLMRRGGRSLRA